MDGEVTRYRPSWKTPDADEMATARPRKVRVYKPRQPALTAAQDRWLLKAWKLRQKLTDKAIADRLGLRVSQLQHHIYRVRQGQ